MTIESPWRAFVKSITRKVVQEGGVCFTPEFSPHHKPVYLLSASYTSPAFLSAAGKTLHSLPSEHNIHTQGPFGSGTEKIAFPTLSLNPRNSN